MNKRPIESSSDKDLRGVEPALRRAAQRARERAIATGTNLVVSRNGVVELISPEQLLKDAQELAERAGHYSHHQ